MPVIVHNPDDTFPSTKTSEHFLHNCGAGIAQFSVGRASD